MPPSNTISRAANHRCGSSCSQHTPPQHHELGLSSDYIQTTFGLHPDYIQTTFGLHLDNIQTTCRLHSDYIRTTFRLHSDCIQTTFRLHPDHIQTTFRPHPDYSQTTFRLHPDCIPTQTTVRLHPDCIQTTVREVADLEERRLATNLMQAGKVGSAILHRHMRRKCPHADTGFLFRSLLRTWSVGCK